MMDAIEYFKEKKRMVAGCSVEFCEKCPLSAANNKSNSLCSTFEQQHPEKAVAIVEQWAKEHPRKTYKSVFLEMFPNAKTTKEGYPDFCLKRLLGTSSCDITCGDCWNREVEE